MTEPTPIRSVDDLTALRERLAGAFGRFEKRILICSTGCRALGAAELGEAFRQKVADAGLSDHVAVVETGCHGLCAMAPVIVIEPLRFHTPVPGELLYFVERRIVQSLIVNEPPSVTATAAPCVSSRIDSTAAKIGSGFITIPPPPPYGSSSVVR